jgi:hypothetical protein
MLASRHGSSISRRSTDLHLVALLAPVRMNPMRVQRPLGNGRRTHRGGRACSRNIEKMPPAKPNRGLPDTLYHYTDIAGLEGIYTTGELWGTHVSYMNDTSELQIGLDAVSALLERGLNEFMSENLWGEYEPPEGLGRLEDLKELINIVDYAKEAECYVVSLSKEHDQLSQWRAYAKAGYCIGFSTEALFQSVYPWRRLGEVQYFSDERNRDIPLAIVELLRREIERFESGESDENQTPESRKFRLADSVAESAVFMKDRSFEEEREVRIVEAMTDSGDIFFTGSRFGMTPRTKIPLIDGAIKSITVGPGVHADLRLRSLSMYVRKKGFKGSDPASALDNPVGDSVPGLVGPPATQCLSAPGSLQPVQQRTDGPKDVLQGAEHVPASACRRYCNLLAVFHLGGEVDAQRSTDRPGQSTVHFTCGHTNFQRLVLY